MLRIAQCTDSFLPVSDGAGRVSYAYADALSRRSHECYVITHQKNAGYRGAFPFEILDYMAMPLFNAPQYRTGIAAVDKHYTNRVDAIRFDVIHAHTPGVSGSEALRLADRLRVPLIGTFHPKYCEDLLHATYTDALQGFGRRQIADFYNRCDAVWTANEHGAALLSDYGCTNEITIMENGAATLEADPAAIAAARATYHLSDAPILLYVGRIDRRADLKPLIEAAALLQERGVAFQMLFAGMGPDEQPARNLSKRLAVSANVRFLGYIADPHLLNGLYAGASLFLFPQKSVSAGLVIREAAAQETAALITRGNRTTAPITDGVNGLISGGSAKEIADRVQAFLSHPELAGQLGKAARQTIAVPWDTIFDRVEQRYGAQTRREKKSIVRKRGLFRRELTAVDQTLEKRTLDLMQHFLTQDMQHVYAYPHTRQKPMQAPVIHFSPLPRATPESQGVHASAILSLFDAVNADPEANGQELIVLRHGKVIGEGCWAPYDAQYPHQLYSLSKSITSTAIGLLVDDGLLQLDEHLVDIFPDKAPDDPDHAAFRLTVRHLLSMSTGSRFNEVGTALGTDWVWEFLHADTKFPAGTAFEYNSMNTYMLAAIVQKKTGDTMLHLLQKRIFTPLGITEATWETCPKGIEKGGWGLSLTVESVAKLGQLYLNHGRWIVDGIEKQLLSEAWVNDATRTQIETPNGECTFGYGHQIWMAPHPGGYLFNGAFGQYMIALPDLDVIVVLFSGTSKLFAQGGMMSYVDSAFSQVSDIPYAKNPAAADALRVTISGLTCRYRKPFYRTDLPAADFSMLTDFLAGKVYTFSPNLAGLLPTVVASVHNNYSTGLTRFSAKSDGNGGLFIDFDESRVRNTLHVTDAQFTPSTVTSLDDTHQVRTSAQFGYVSPDEFVLVLCVCFIETPCTRILTFSFREDRVTLLCDESPSVKDASAMLLELAGVTRMEVFRMMMPLLKQDNLQNRLRTYTTTQAEGRL